MGTNSKDKRDIYYRLSKKEGYRARSAYKLKHIHDTYDIFRNVERVVDLCGAPGSWSQYVSRMLPENTIICVDLQTIAPIPNVITLKKDITSLDCINSILEIFKNKKADLILFDGAPDVTGIHDLDEFLQSQLICSALNISLKIGALGSSFIGKCFRGGNFKYIFNHFKRFYRDVVVLKPKSSRSSSIECFLYCQRLYNTSDNALEIETEILVDDVELISCGNGPDPDLTTDFLESKTSSPIQTPIEPPYADVIDLRKSHNK